MAARRPRAARRRRRGRGDRRRRAREAARPRSPSASSSSMPSARTARRPVRTELPGDREMIRGRATAAALHLVRRLLESRTHHGEPGALPSRAMTGSGSSSRSSSRTTSLERARSLGRASTSRGGRRRRELPRHARVPRQPAARRRSEPIVGVLREEAAATRAVHARAGPLPRDALRRHARSRRSERRGDARSPSACSARLEDARRVRARAPPWLPHVTVAALPRAAAARRRRCRRSGRSLRPEPLLCFHACTRQGRGTRYWSRVR